jgi:uncharacterized protein YycO
MPRVLILLLAYALGNLATSTLSASITQTLQNGDILFTGSAAGQGEAIIAATESPLTHCGIAFQKSGQWWVLEAVQPVGVISLTEFLARDESRVFAVYRLKEPLSSTAFQKALDWGTKQIGLNYDEHFRWDNQQLYCSELVWKFYQQANVELCKPRTFGDYNLQLPSVQKIIQERYGGMDQLPLEEKVVAPSDLAASDKVQRVYGVKH